MKECKTCKNKKELTFFPKNGKGGFRGDCKICHNLKNKKWKKKTGYYGKYSEKYKEYQKEYNKKYRREVLNQKPVIKLTDKERITRKNYSRRKWTKNNLAKEAYWSSLKRKRVKLATPKWLSKEQIKYIQNLYVLAKTKEEKTGLKYHVDHIMPLKGVDSSGRYILCGLHVPWNLQVIESTENLIKSNKIIDKYL